MAFQWTLIASGPDVVTRREFITRLICDKLSGKKVKSIYINTREIAHTREQKTTTNAESRVQHRCAPTDLRMSEPGDAGRVGFQGVVQATVTEVDGAPDGDGPLVGSWWCVRERKERHSFVRSSHKLRHPRVKSSLKLRAVDSLMNWVLPPRPLSSHHLPSRLSRRCRHRWLGTGYSVEWYYTLFLRSSYGQASTTPI